MTRKMERRADRCAGKTALSVVMLLAGTMLSGCSDAPVEQVIVGQAHAAVAPAPDGEMHVYFGDLHLHTAYSMDAASARTQTMPDDAYRFARGLPVSYFGKTVKRLAPLDFLAVTDHAEYLGNVRLAAQGKIKLRGDWSGLNADTFGPQLFDTMNKAVAGLYGEDTPGLSNPALVHDNWQEIIASAERNYEPGKFTTFVAFEYSASFRGNPRGQMHRNVIFRGPNYPAMPFAATDSLKPEILWAYAEQNRARGIDSLMIPHNTNLSNGRGFALVDSWNQPIDADYARRRTANEPLVEITQNKGTGETRPDISRDDEFADFELLAGNPAQYDGSYVRPALLRGLAISEQTGVNPFELGFAGASDYHSGLSASEEDNFPGGLGLHDLPRDAKRIVEDDDPILGGKLGTLSASGITGVWAKANTREEIFDAMRRREAFATSGPRIRVRVFGGWDKPGAMLKAPDWAKRAYAWGVPMGGNLRGGDAKGRVPNFVFQAAKDPLSGNLDRIQIIKLWRAGGVSHEKIYNVAWSKGRKLDAKTGKLAPVGNTVDVKAATYSNSIGATELVGSWSDPDFDPAHKAIYYARVIEIPTPRWVTYLAARSGTTVPAEIKPWLQERAWTSPIYYTP